MKSGMDLESFLCCPKCHSDLNRCGDMLYCDHCGASFPVVDGVACFEKRISLPKHLQSQISYFESEESVSSETHSLSPWQSKYLARFFKNASSLDGALVIDCGTGSGYMAIELAKRGAHVVAIDLTLRSVVRLSKLAAKLGLDKRILSVCCRGECLPVKTASASFFISNAVLEHIPDEPQAISEINRVTVDGATLMLAVPVAYRYVNPVLMPLNWVHDKRIGHLRRYDAAGIASKFTGWEKLQVYYTGHTAKVVKTIINLWCPLFDAVKVEEEDGRLEQQAHCSSNIISFLKKQNSSG